MKKLLLATISFYQSFLSLPLRMALGTSGSCRYPVSCSEYAKIAIAKHGSLRGGKMAVLRILSCQPFTITRAEPSMR